MAVKSWNAGDVLTAADMDAWAVDQIIIKPTAEHRTSSTLTNDSALAAPVAANAVYVVELCLWYEGGTGGDLQIAWSVPASATHVNTYLHGLITGAASGTDDSITANTSNPGFGALGAGVFVALLWKSVLTTSATSGTLQLRTAQLVTNGTDTIIDANSYLRLTRAG